MLDTFKGNCLLCQYQLKASYEIKTHYYAYCYCVAIR